MIDCIKNTFFIQIRIKKGILRKEQNEKEIG